MEKPEAEHVSNDERLEKHPTVEAFPQAARAEGGVVLTVDVPGESPLHLAKDGHTVLLPQPTDDPADPLNWPSWKKHAILLTIAWGAFCADFTSAAGSATIIVQAMEWHESVNKINETNSINVLMMALGGLLWVPMTSFIGRAPTLFWSNLLGLLFSIGTALSPNFITFYAMRALTGFFITSAQTISIAFIKDMFFFHERARKIGLWALLYIASPFWGPLVGNFILGGTNSWENVFWVCVAVCGVDMILIVTFLDETWRYIQTLIKPPVFIILVAYLLFFAWAIGINITTAILFGTPREFGGYGYSYNAVGFLYFSPIVGILLGEIFGHFFNDAIARRYAKKHHGVFEPEARLNMIYISSVFMIIGLVVLGQALLHHVSVGAVIMGWGLHSFGIMTASVAVTAYVLDSYPTAPAEVSGWSNFARAIGGFGVGYFQQPWGAKVGYGESFGTQAGIVAAGVVLVAMVHRFGHSLRVKAGPVK
ncbi:hypothetical protein AK830_g3620 [Neonectria ditissima]|uniref:Major facilitator superfamily (MFS) profile domain-containing protein n=1 Tax=Neonectria ditissima TaxID=78410 RepID=A0A0P7BNJ9_9HYPO|nr:hypothetical protein AK830_g3620 [Neonectria ditissima]